MPDGVGGLPGGGGGGVGVSSACVVATAAVLMVMMAASAATVAVAVTVLETDQLASSSRKKITIFETFAVRRRVDWPPILHDTDRHFGLEAHLGLRMDRLRGVVCGAEESCVLVGSKVVFRGVWSSWGR